MSIEVSYCIVNTEQRALLERCLDAIAAEQRELPFATEVLVLDNASRDGSVGMARAHPVTTELIRREQRRGKAENDSTLMQRARGRYCLLLNEDSELMPGATRALHDAIDTTERAATAGAKLLRPDGAQYPSAWRFPTPATAFWGAVGMHRTMTVQSRGDEVREVDWAQSAALLVLRDAAARIGWMDPAFFVYSDEVDFCKRLHDAGWKNLYVPQAEAIHHEQLSTGSVPKRRIVELSRNRERYMRKHHSVPAALAVRWLTAWTYALRALAAYVLPRHDPARYWQHVQATLHPDRGEGLREAAADYNRGGPRL